MQTGASYTPSLIGKSPGVFRSSGIPKGLFSRLGNFHMHVDGGSDSKVILNTLEEMERHDVLSKINTVVGSISGPQRQDFVDTYESHTPSIDEHEVFDYFSTSYLESRSQAISTLKHTLSSLYPHPGIVIEVEWVIAKIDVEGKWGVINLNKVSPIESDEVGFERSATLPFEIHHAFDIPTSSPPFELQRLLLESSELGLRVGGWFNFLKEGVWAYRSNAFSIEDGLEENARAQHGMLNQYLKRSGLNYRLWTLIERVIGVWRTPIQLVS